MVIIRTESMNILKGGATRLPTVGAGGAFRKQPIVITVEFYVKTVKLFEVGAYTAKSTAESTDKLFSWRTKECFEHVQLASKQGRLSTNLWFTAIDPILDRG